MEQVPNDLLQSLIRHIPLILDGLDEDKLRTSLKLGNAVRLTKKNLQRLKKIDSKNETTD
jgi:hypothetical protein